MRILWKGGTDSRAMMRNVPHMRLDKLTPDGVYKCKPFNEDNMRRASSIADGPELPQARLCAEMLSGEDTGLKSTLARPLGCPTIGAHLTHENDPDPEMRPEPIDDEKRETLLAGIAVGVPMMYKYMEPFRTSGLPRHEPIETFIRTTREIGQNEPCPCGSGLKYKKCCGKN